jgi:hypothetical protein
MLLTPRGLDACVPVHTSSTVIPPNAIGVQVLAGLALLLGCVADPRGGSAKAALTQDGGTKHNVVTTAPPTLGALETGELDPHGDRIGVVCVTCHGMFTEPIKMPQHASDTAGPHVGLHFNHGVQPCANCHAPEHVNQLRLADGRIIAPAQAALLCRQCHGLQARDYDHGAHGGMRGHWDETRGVRERNSCVSCHDPHEPAYPQYEPAPPPRDRFIPLEGIRHG